MADAREFRTTLVSSRIVLAVVYLIAVAALMAGSALHSSMGGELESMGATAAEETQWAWGNGLTRAGFILVVVCAVIVVGLRKRLSLGLRGSAGVVIAGTMLAGFAFFLTWMASMA